MAKPAKPGEASEAWRSLVKLSEAWRIQARLAKPAKPREASQIQRSLEKEPERKVPAKPEAQKNTKTIITQIPKQLPFPKKPKSKQNREQNKHENNKSQKTKNLTK